jgi:hypothetical protein
MMVYNTQNYEIFGLRPSSSILKIIEHNVFETGSVSSDLRTETDPVSETLCSLIFRILDDGQSPKMS